jgi:hypothetical protein
VKADRARLLVVAAAGIVVAHAADYALAFPDPARRGRVLAATGHGYWPIAVVVAVVCGVIGLAVTARRGWRGIRSHSSVLGTATRLAAGQVLLFAVLETVERLAVAAHPVAHLTSGQFALGVLVQIAVAVVAAVLLRAVERGASRLASAVRRPGRPKSAPQHWLPRTDEAVVRWWGVAGDARGPPLALPA